MVAVFNLNRLLWQQQLLQPKIDLHEFKLELLEGIKTIINNKTGLATKKWLKSPEVRDLLSISPGTLQNLRINGTLPYTKVGGVIYYDYDDIQKVMQDNRIHNKF